MTTNNENITKNIWQVAAGDGERDYSKVFLDYGVMLIGPGTKCSDYRLNKKDYEKEYKDDAQTLRALDQFEKEADEKDLVVLKGRKKKGKWEAVAVGRIKLDYSFKAVFGDVEGFQLQHCRQVKWRQPTRVKYIRLGRGRFSHVITDLDKVERLWTKGKPIHKKFEIPEDTKSVSHNELIASLADKGLPRQNAKRIADEIERLQNLAEWYEGNGEDCDVPEHETRTFLIVPLIMSLGWDEKKVKIEWKHKDVALFDAYDYSSKKNEPVVIIESKRLWDGLGGASDQATEYAKKHPTCKKLVITDGIRYKLLTWGDDKWDFTAYLNLLTPKRKHPYKPDVGGAVSFLSKMFQRRQSNRRV
jgi:hypothetical protein